MDSPARNDGGPRYSLDPGQQGSPLAPGQFRPRSLRLLDGLVLGSAGYDNSVRWLPGERLEQLFERQCDKLAANGCGDHLAVSTDWAELTYHDLDSQANQLARYLVGSGIQPGDRLGLLFNQPVDSYVAILAALKSGASYVPMDSGYPVDRLSYIVADANVRTVLSLAGMSALTEGLAGQASIINLDQVRQQVADESQERLSPRPVTSAVDDLCYVIYTSGTTGRPKGVAVTHASICNFVRTAAEVYGLTSDDRVYQGMTIAFDFSFEEIWVPWMAGATLVPKPSGDVLLGADLREFINERRVTALCCVPTLLATIDEDLPLLRFLLVSGEPCPRDLVTRWHRPGRRFLNVYGPTEATVTASWTVVDPARRVTIGVPLPTYSIVILDPEASAARSPGEIGEIGIAGIGLAQGYLNRPDLTARAFIPDFLGIPGNRSGLIYRSGDLGRIGADGEIEHLGRIDTQVKISGYRIELTEIESVLLQVPGVAQAVVEAGQEPADPGSVGLVAYYSVHRATAAPDPAAIYAHLCDRLPSYMIPDFLEQLDTLPLLPSGKADRKRLPPPRGPRRLAGIGEHAPPESAAEKELAELLADVLGLPEVSVVSNFFADLGADSLLMARFNAAVRRRAGWSASSMRHVYRYPTIRQLAAALGQDEPVAAAALTNAPPVTAGSRVDGNTTTEARTGSRADPRLPRRTMGKPHFALCGLLQIAAFVSCALAGAWVLDRGAGWVLAAHGAVVIAIRGVLAGSAVMLVIGTLPIAGKWLLIGRWKEQRIPIWSLAYVRFWIAKTLVTWNPLAMLCVGSPPYVLYLRALGARIGPGAVIFSRHIPVCTDLLTIGAGSVIRKDAYLSCYRADGGLIETGPVTLGSGVFIGEASVLDIGTAVGDNGQVGHASSLHQGQSVPAGQCWHGSPARQAKAGCEYRMPSGASVSQARRVSYGAMRLIVALFIAGPLAFVVFGLLFSRPAPLYLWFGLPDPASLSFYRDALLISTIAFFGAIIAVAVVTATVPRFLSRILKEERIYPLYGWHYMIQRAVARLSNVPFFTALFGDSSAIVGYLQLIGYKLAPVEQTGSNFGMAVRHDVPWLCAAGTGTVVSDGLTFMNADYSAGSFRIRSAAIGPQNFLGNRVLYPAGGRTGANCMMATKVMVPTSGPVRENVGLLGSPCFEVPRSVRRDRTAGTGDADTPTARRAKLAAKARHNAVTAALYLLVRWLFVLGIVIIGMLPLHIRGQGEALSTFLALCLELAFVVAYFTLVERAVTGFKGLRPRMCSIYHLDFWRHERYWKLPETAYMHFFNGTPFKSVLWRLLGVKIGRRLFDDGCAIIERTLVAVGDNATLNAGSTLHSHSMEDGTFKSDYVIIGPRCTIGAGAFVHYGAVMEEDSSLAADSFLMKGEQVAARTAWAGNPAAEVTSGKKE
jgi:non-ribosomal peptide synthetase-like protein